MQRGETLLYAKSRKRLLSALRGKIEDEKHSFCFGTNKRRKYVLRFSFFFQINTFADIYWARSRQLDVLRKVRENFPNILGEKNTKAHLQFLANTDK